MQPVGRQIFVDLWGCPRDVASSSTLVERAIREVALACHCTLVDLHLREFHPVGLTGIAVLAESHLIVHTWPERGYVAVDMFTCGETADSSQAVPVLERHFHPTQVKEWRIERGANPGDGKSIVGGE